MKRTKSTSILSDKWMAGSIAVPLISMALLSACDRKENGTNGRTSERARPGLQRSVARLNSSKAGSELKREQMTSMEADPEFKRLLAEAMKFAPIEYDPFGPGANEQNDLARYLAKHHPEAGVEWIERNAGRFSNQLFFTFASYLATFNSRLAWEQFENLSSDSKRRAYFHNLFDHAMKSSTVSTDAIDRLWKASDRYGFWFDEDQLWTILRKESAIDPIAAWSRVEKHDLVAERGMGVSKNKTDARGEPVTGINLVSFLESGMNLDPSMAYPIELLEKLPPEDFKDTMKHAIGHSETNSNLAPLLEWVGALPALPENEPYYESLGYWFAAHDNPAEAAKWINLTRPRTRWEFLGSTRDRGQDFSGLVEIPAFNKLDDLDK